MAEKEVHGGLEMRVQPAEQDDEQVTHHHGQVHAQEQGKNMPAALAGWGAPGGRTGTHCSGSPSSRSSPVY